MLTFGSLFAGIGGFDLGFERAGMKCEWQVEIDPFCRQVLERHWPDARRWDDVRTFPPAGDWRVDVICGGFPCQDISNAGKLAGIEGERSGLWTEMARVIRTLRPTYVVVENVAALLVRGMGTVLKDLAASGYDAEWDVLSAAAFGAEHLRERCFIVAYPVSSRLPVWRKGRAFAEDARIFGAGLGFAVGTEAAGLERRGASRWSGDVHGIPQRVDRIKALGNAVVPQVAEWIGRRIVTGHQLSTGADNPQEVTR